MKHIKEAETVYPVNDVIKKRWSPRSFQDISVKTDDLYTLIEAASWAPSCFNEQPWRFMTADKKEDRERYEKLFSCLNEKNQKWVPTAPMLGLSLAHKVFGHNGKDNFYSIYDLGQSMAIMTAQASMIGLYIHQMAGFDKDKAREVLRIPEDFEPVTMFVIGYPGDSSKLENPFRKMEESPRTRKSVDEILIKSF